MTLFGYKLSKVSDAVLRRIGLAVETLVAFNLDIINFANTLTGGTYQTLALEGGTGGLVAKGNAANTSTATDTGIFLFRLPECYVAGSAIAFTCSAKYGGSGTVGATKTIDLTAKKISQSAFTAGSDLVTTSALALTNAYAGKTFDITPTGLEAGDVLQLMLTTALQETAGTDLFAYVGGPRMLLSVQG
jgi:hypothetical protein